MKRISRIASYLQGVFSGVKLCLKVQNLSPIKRLAVKYDVKPGAMIEIAVQSRSTSSSQKAALVAITVFDKRGELVPFSWSNKSKAVGNYKYLRESSMDQASNTRFRVQMPETASSLEIRGVQWDKTVRTFIEGTISMRDLSELQEFSTINEQSEEVLASDFSCRVKVNQEADRATIRFVHRSGATASAGPITVKYLSADGRKVLNPSDLAQHRVHGAFISLNGESEETATQVVLNLPREAEWIELQGLDWGQKTAILIGPPTIVFQKRESSIISDFLNRIPDGAPLFVIDTTAPPLGHKTLALRPNNLTLNYEKLGIWTIFIPFGSLQGFSMAVSEKVLQVPRDRYSELVAELSKRRDTKSNIYICSSFPNFESLTSMSYLKAMGWKIVYECRDDMEEFNRVGYSKWYTQELERYCLRLSDIVIAVSPALAEKLGDMLPTAIDVTVSPNAVSTETVDGSAELRSSAQLTVRETSRVVGYVGHLTESWFDWQVLVGAAKKLPDVSFEIVGHGIPDNISLPQNVTYLGPKSHSELVNIVANWKVGLIPFIDSPLTRSVDPNKIYEYFAWGLRCVTSSMGSVSAYPSTWVYEGIEEFVSALREAVDLPMEEAELAEISRFAAVNTWRVRAQEMSDILLNDSYNDDGGC